MARRLNGMPRFAAALDQAQRDGWGWDGCTCLHLMIATAAALSDVPVIARIEAMCGGAFPTSRRSMLRFMARKGGLEALVECAAGACGFEEIDPAVAASGDWGVADFAGDPALVKSAEGVVRGSDVWYFRVVRFGLVPISADIAPVRRAWAVG